MRKNKILPGWKKGRNSIYTNFDLWYKQSHINTKNFLLVEDREEIRQLLESRGLRFEDSSKYDSFPLPFMFKLKSVEIQKDKGISFIYYGIFKINTYSYFFGDVPWEYEMKYFRHLSTKAKRQLIYHLKRGGSPPSFNTDRTELRKIAQKFVKARKSVNPHDAPSS